MRLHYEDAEAGVTLFHGDCIEVMRSLSDDSIDSIVTDPPYGLEFMGKEWDGADGFRRSLNAADVGRDNVFGRASRTSPEYKAGRLFQEWCEVWAVEAFRVLKPGGHLLSFGGTRTFHRMAVAVEDAGFEIRDSIAWLYGSGFPKSLDVSKAINKASGAVREKVRKPGAASAYASNAGNERPWMQKARDEGFIEVDGDEPVSDAAKVWEGWGTALKPAFEPIVVARKPLVGTVAQNVLEHGTGALNIAGSRVGTEPAFKDRPGQRSVGGLLNTTSELRVTSGGAGRWPTNVLLDESQAAALDAQTGVTESRQGILRRGATTGASIGGAAAYGTAAPQDALAGYSDSGGASRFFPTFRYEAKAPGTERPNVDGVQHATVKPVELMRWLVRLVTPPGGTVLEPFAGSGATIEAALKEGFRCVAVELEAAHLPLIMQRIQKPMQQSLFGDWDES